MPMSPNDFQPVTLCGIWEVDSQKRFIKSCATIFFERSPWSRDQTSFLLLCVFSGCVDEVISVSSLFQALSGLTVKSGARQVWSLTQFYSVVFSQSRISGKKCVFNKRTIKVCVRCCWQCPGTFAINATHLTVSMFLCSHGSNAWGELRASWRV